MSLKWPPKDDGDFLDYTIDWSDWLEDVGESIINSIWTVPAGLTTSAESHDDASATIWIQGGTIGVTYVLTNSIFLPSGRIVQRNISLAVKNL